MKKFCGACAALALGAALLFAGCSLFGADGSKVMEFVKGKTFTANPSRWETSYEANLSVKEDHSYSLKVSYGSGVLQNYSYQGTTMEYMGYEEDEFTSSWLGVSQSNTNYIHVVKLTGATFEKDESVYTFYLLAESSSKNSDSFSTKLVASDSTATGTNNLGSIVNGSYKMTLQKN